MLKNYKYVDYVHCRLHEFIIAFFKRIEFETKPFDISFFESDFQEIVNRHRTILKNRFKQIYEKIQLWTQTQRSQFITQIVESNDIENICNGAFTPLNVSQIHPDIRVLVKDLFDDLYNQVLDGKPFKKEFNTNLRKHFEEFRDQNKEITLCPICGIGELKTKFDKTRDQYDHYLPISIYPLSSVNFKNLVPICKECNSLDVKAHKDIINLVSNGKLFYIYDTSHKGISINLKIAKDDSKIENIQWQINFSNPDGKIDEIKSWQVIYDIDNRYIGFITGRIEGWYKSYWQYKNSSILNFMNDSQKDISYFTSLEIDNENFLNFLRLPSLNTFITGSILLKAEIEMKNYS